MTKKSKHNNNWLGLSWLTVLGLVFSTIALGTLSTLANEKRENNINTPVLFQPPPGEKPPKDTEGGGSRDEGSSCDRDIATRSQQIPGTINKLTAIAPNSYNGLTTAERPTFWVNLPKTSAPQAILLIKKGSDADWHQLDTHWQQSINLKGNAGIIGIKLSKDAPVLEIGKNYQWVLALVCGNQPNPNDPLVAAEIKRIDRSQISRIATTITELDKASLYARKGIWYDALDILVAEKSSLNNWQDIWVKYLRSGGLSNEIANEPVRGTLTD